jgi:CheY-like chemotaxis protein
LTTGAATPALTATQTNGKHGVVQKLRVLLAEDNMVNQKLAERMLGKLHHRVVIANNGKEAFERIQQEPFDLVLMDMQMPEMDGLAATQAVREWEKGRGRHIPIIAMTANAMKGDDLVCLEAGMDGYIAKPISLMMLKKTIEQVLVDSGETQALAGSDLAEY